MCLSLHSICVTSRCKLHPCQSAAMLLCDYIAGHTSDFFFFCQHQQIKKFLNCSLNCVVLKLHKAAFSVYTTHSIPFHVFANTWHQIWSECSLKPSSEQRFTTRQFETCNYLQCAGLRHSVIPKQLHSRWIISVATTHRFFFKAFFFICE